MGKQYHYQLKGNKIVAWNNSGNTWSEIATVIIERPCKHLLRHAQLAEDIEQLMDTFIGDTAGYKKESPCPEISISNRED